MGCEAGQCKTSNPEDIFIVTPSLEGRPTKAKVASSPHEAKLAPLDTNTVFQCLGGFQCLTYLFMKSSFFTRYWSW